MVEDLGPKKEQEYTEGYGQLLLPIRSYSPVFASNASIYLQCSSCWSFKRCSIEDRRSLHEHTFSASRSPSIVNEKLFVQGFPQTMPIVLVKKMLPFRTFLQFLYKPGMDMCHALRGVFIIENISFHFVFLYDLSCSHKSRLFVFSSKWDVYSKFLLTSTWRKYSNPMSITTAISITSISPSF